MEVGVVVVVEKGVMVAVDAPVGADVVEYPVGSGEIAEEIV